MKLTPKNWSDFQHYKDRSPAWIKLHRKILDDFEFSCLPVASRALAPMLWLIASEYEDGKIEASIEAIAFRLRTSVESLQEAMKPLIEAGFFVSDSKPLAARKRKASLEREEEEEEEKRESRAVAVATRPPDHFEKFWKEYPKRKGANPKKPAQDSFARALKSGDPGEIIAAAARYRAECEREGQIGTPYVAQAVTWLNQRRWQDYPEGDGASPVSTEALERTWTSLLESEADGKGWRSRNVKKSDIPPEFIARWAAARALPAAAPNGAHHNESEDPAPPGKRDGGPLFAGRP